MVQFSLKEWLEDKNREICTRDGRKAVILDTEFETGDGKKSILAKCIYNGVAAVYTYDSNGKANNIGESENDLFFTDIEQKVPYVTKKDLDYIEYLKAKVNRYNENCVSCIHRNGYGPCDKANNTDVKNWINENGIYSDLKIMCPEWYDEY